MSLGGPFPEDILSFADQDISYFSGNTLTPVRAFDSVRTTFSLVSGFELYS
jgi:hypothetical protein